LQILHC